MTIHLLSITINLHDYVHQYPRGRRSISMIMIINLCLNMTINLCESNLQSLWVWLSISVSMTVNRHEYDNQSLWVWPPTSMSMSIYPCEYNHKPRCVWPPIYISNTTNLCDYDHYSVRESNDCTGKSRRSGPTRCLHDPVRRRRPLMQAHMTINCFGTITWRTLTCIIAGYITVCTI